MENEVTIDDPKAVLDALERAKADAKKYRERLQELQSEYEALQGQMNELDSMREANDGLKSTLRDSKIQDALKLQGINKPERVLKYIDKDKVTLTDDYNIEGLDAAVETVKADFPELFDPKRRVGGAADLFEKGDVKPSLSGTELQARRLFNRG